MFCGLDPINTNDPKTNAIHHSLHVRQIKIYIKISYKIHQYIRLQFVSCVQFDHNLCRVDLRKAECRYKLFVQGIEINNTSYQFDDTNQICSPENLKLRSLSLPLSVADSTVLRIA